MLNKYETIYILKPTLEADAIKANVEKFNGLIESEGGKVSETQEWGMKKLAYPIQKIEQGYYVLTNFEANPEFISELESVYKITDDVMKFITVKKEEEKEVKE
ncbi:MAG: 30S ribosomal protein S6 [Clostridia bacterium]|nr:30S ribosomal protein S6 [Clostridia bacterium]